MGNPKERTKLTKRMKQVVVGVAALAALALGGSTLASAGTTTAKPTVEATSGSDRDAIQSGDQTTPDTPATRAVSKASKVTSRAPAASKAKTAASEAPGVESGLNSDGPSGHADEATGSRSASAEAPGSEKPDTAGEKAGSETPNSDGPGGHADEPGNANADYQSSGQE